MSYVALVSPNGVTKAWPFIDMEEAHFVQASSGTSKFLYGPKSLSQEEDMRKCEACGTGADNHSYKPYRGHALCEQCILMWRKLDRTLKRSSKWEEFLSPPRELFSNW